MWGSIDGLPSGPHTGSLNPHPFASLVETHTGVVCLLGERAYKLKKPLKFGFLDFTTRQARQAACQREVELNARLAPDVYLGVADVVGPDGALCDHLVVMRRMPAATSLATLAQAGEPLGPQIEDIARRLADFHARADRSAIIEQAGSARATLARWEANAAEMAPLAPAVFDPTDLERQMALARRYLEGRAPLLASRVAAGRICDGHGDLLASDVFCLDDGPRLLDCLEFDDQLRYGDVLADVAFLAMDLEHLGRSELAQSLLSHYRRFANDAWPATLAHHYLAYRAQVRALVAGLRHAQGDPAAAETAHAHLAQSLEHLGAGRVRLVLVGGGPGTGKTTLAAGVGHHLGAAVLRSDEVRKALAGPGLGQSAPEDFATGLYAPHVTEAVYHELLERARARLVLGVSVVLDATFADRSWRQAAECLAAECLADLDQLVCQAPLPLAQERVTTRAQRGVDPSDATAAVAARFAEHQVPWPEAHPVDTTLAPEAVLSEVTSLLGAGPQRLG